MSSNFRDIQTTQDNEPIRSDRSTRTKMPARFQDTYLIPSLSSSDSWIYFLPSGSQCMYVCMHACMRDPHACWLIGMQCIMYLCKSVVCMYSCMYVCMYVLVYVCRHVCMYWSRLLDSVQEFDSVQELFSGFLQSFSSPTCNKYEDRFSFVIQNNNSR